MKNLLIALVALAPLTLVAGCSGGGEVANEKVNVPTSSKPAPPGSASSPTTISDPGKVQDGGAYKIVPPDPNDPKFKPDPKLGGGS